MSDKGISQKNNLFDNSVGLGPIIIHVMLLYLFANCETVTVMNTTVNYTFFIHNIGPTVAFVYLIR